jgi:hypothetical protein
MFANLMDSSLDARRVQFREGLTMKRYEAASEAAERSGRKLTVSELFLHMVAPEYREFFSVLEGVAISNRAAYFGLLQPLQEHLYTIGMQEWGAEWLDAGWFDYLQRHVEHPKERYVMKDGKPIGNPESARIVGIVLPGFRWQIPDSAQAPRHCIVSYPMPTIAVV